MDQDKNKKLILGGVFETHTKMDAEGNIVEKDDFHLRIYWHLWHSGAIKKLRDYKLHVLLTIAMHCDKNGEGWPGVRRIAKMIGYNKDTVTKAVEELIEDGFIERRQGRGEAGKFGGNTYSLKLGVDAASDNTGHGKNAGNSTISPRPTSPDTGLTGQADVGHKEDPFPKKDNDCMNGPSRSSSDQDDLDFEKIDDREKEIWDALYTGAKWFRVDSYGHTAEGYVPDFYFVLQKHFPSKISPDVIKLAFRISRQKMVDMYDGNDVDLKNPPGWFKMAYSDALKAYAGMKYLDDKRKKEEELERFMAEKEYSFGN